MVLGYYKLAEQPFGVTPDPRYLYLSATHREALASVIYGMAAGRGFTALVARPGMGKTTLLFDVLRKVKNSARTVFLFQSQCSPRDLLRSLLADLGIEEAGDDLPRMHRKLNETLLRESSQGKRLIVVIDEAQNLDEPVLEVVRMLSNFETPREKLMHIILAGQPQLAEKLATTRLTQLRQRISIFARLKPFDAEETRLYMEHRLRVAGYDFSRPLFSRRALDMIAACTEGIPRNINNICFNAMSLGYVAKQETIDVDIIREVVSDLDLSPLFEDSAGASNLEKPSAPLRNVILSEPTRPFLLGWPLRLAACLALVVTLSWPFIRSNKNIANVLASGLARAEKSSLANLAPSPDARAPRPSQTSTSSRAGDRPDDSRFVIVLPNQSLYGICIENFGRYDEQVLAEIRALNPWLRDPEHIEIGRKIIIPSIEATSQTINYPAAEHIPDALAAEPEKP
jgi:general secretion pathway protein A